METYPKESTHPSRQQRAGRAELGNVSLPVRTTAPPHSHTHRAHPSVQAVTPQFHCRHSLPLSLYRSSALSHSIPFIILTPNEIALYCVILHSNIVVSKISPPSYIVASALFFFSREAGAGGGPRAYCPPVTGTDLSR